MPLKLLTSAERLGSQIPALVQRGADLTIATANVPKPPTVKSAVVKVCLEEIRRQIFTEAEDALDTAKTMHVLMEGEYADAPDWQTWRDALDVAIQAELSPYYPMIGTENAAIFTAAMLQQPDGATVIAEALSDAVVKTMKPAGPHMGKFLSAIGITEPMLQEAEKAAQHAAKLYGAEKVQQAAASPPPAPPVPEPNTYEAATAAQWADYEAGNNPPPPPAPPPAPPAPPAPPPAPPAPPPAPAAYTETLSPLPPPFTETQPSQVAAPPGAVPTAAEISTALQDWSTATGPDYDAVAKKLGLSVSTLRNRCSGRTEGKLTGNQARYLLSYIDGVRTKLDSVVEVLSRIKG
jgi:hypothetical protein